jgi:hypothetical protein
VVELPVRVEINRHPISTEKVRKLPLFCFLAIQSGQSTVSFGWMGRRHMDAAQLLEDSLVWGAARRALSFALAATDRRAQGAFMHLNRKIGHVEITPVFWQCQW